MTFRFLAGGVGLGLFCSRFFSTDFGIFGALNCAAAFYALSFLLFSRAASSAAISAESLKRSSSSKGSSSDEESRR